MNVRISHGVKLDDVPSTVAEFVDSAIPILNESLELCNLVSKMLLIAPDKSETIASLLENIRINLSSIDGKLSDSQNIFEGYTRAKNQPEEPSVVTPTTVPPPETPDVD